MVEYKQILAAEDKVVGGAILTSDLSEVITQKLHRYAELLAAANERARLTGSSGPGRPRKKAVVTSKCSSGNPRIICSAKSDELTL